jgi:hypothetical protein
MIFDFRLMIGDSMIGGVRQSKIKNHKSEMK